jgi:hypothetical protein
VALVFLQKSNISALISKKLSEACPLESQRTSVWYRSTSHSATISWQNVLNILWIRDLLEIKFMTFMAVEKTSYNVVGSVSVATACLCKKQWVTTWVASYITEVAKPDILSSIAGSPSVQIVESFYFQSKSCLEKKICSSQKRLKK